MDRLDAMSLLVAVVESGSLSAAGRKLGIPLATVSRKISDLEAHIKTRLLNRSTRQLTLTDAGRAYVTACKRILEEVSEAERAASGEYSSPKGELIITAPIVFGRLHVLPVIAEFLKTYPDVDIRFMLTDHTLGLLENHVDLAVRVGDLADSSLIAIRIGMIRNVICASPGYFAEHGTPKTPHDLINHVCITFASLMSSDNWIFKKERSEISIPVHSRLVVNTAEAAIDAAIAGAGLTRVLSYQVDNAIQTGALVTTLEQFEPALLPVNFLYVRQPILPLKLRAFIDFAVPRLRAKLNVEAGNN